MRKLLKTKEELKLQLGEVIPQAIQLMSKAAQDAGLSISGTVKEMMELQQNGELISSKVLPHFARRMSEAAQANGGLEKAMDSNRVAMNRMMMSMQEGADAFFKSGFSEGLTELFNNTADMIRNNQVLWKSLGKIVGGVLKGLAWAIKNLVNPALSALGSILHAITELAGNFSALVVGLFSQLGMKLLPESIRQFSLMTRGIGALATAARALALPFVIVLGVLEEIAEFFAPTGKKTFLGFNINDLEGFSPIKSASMNQRSANPVITPPLLGPNVGNQRGAPVVIDNNITIEMDGEVVAEKTTTTSAFTEAFNRALNAGFTGSR